MLRELCQAPQATMSRLVSHEGIEDRQPRRIPRCHVVLEEGMRHFYIRAMQLKAVGGKPGGVDANLLKAVDIAEKVMPYRHHKLAAIKLDEDPVEPAFRPGASMD